MSDQNDIASSTSSARTAELFQEQKQNIIIHTDHLFGRLMLCQWIAAIVAAFLISPRSWAGTQSQWHVHVWAAIFLGGILTSFPVLLAFNQAGKALTRHTIAISQMLMSALLIHLTGGRIETHFHVFGSLAILAFYRDWRVLISASVVVYLDHLLRGMFWPESVYGVTAAPIWRSLEHGWWVIFEVTFLVISIRKSLEEMLVVAERQARLEALKENIENTVAERTAELTRENIERRQAEEDLKKSEAQLAQAQHIARLGSWEWDVVGDMVELSEETRRLYGFKPGQTACSMQECLTRVHADDVARVKRVLAEALETRKPFDCDHRVVLPDGSERVMHGRGEIAVNGQGKPVRILGTAQDVTEAKRAEEALRRSEEQFRQSQKMEAVGRLAGGIAHDFNNLLTVIGGYCALLLERVAKKDSIHKLAVEIGNASERAAVLTRQLLAFSRKQVLQPRILDLNEVVSGMETMLRRVIGEDIELRTLSDSGLGSVKADRGQIEQVILNMAVNARDAMPRGGKLTIRTSNVALDQMSVFRDRELEVGDYVMLAISDTGVGMTEEVKSHLFEPFFTTKGIDKGTGLGLATCYGIISQSGGDIRVYSEPNCGTTFKIYLPRAEQSIAAPSPAVAKDLPSGTESVLVVEDDPSVRGLTTFVLRECGYEVQEASTAKEALALIENGGPFDLVITDVIMPQMSGRELYDELRGRAYEAKILFISGYTDDALAHHGVLEDGLLFLEKPFSPARLTQTVREVLDKKRDLQLQPCP